MSNKRNRNVSTGILYISLAVSDIHIIILNISFDWISQVYFLNLHEMSNMCNIFIFIQETTLEASAWLVAIIAVERIIYVRFPLKAKTICKSRLALVTVLCTLALLLCSNIYIIVRIGPNCTFRTSAFAQFFFKFEIIKATVFQYILPVLVIVPGNIIICRSIIKSSSIRSTGIANNAIERSVTRSLILVSAAYLITMTPAIIYTNLVQNGAVPVDRNVNRFVIRLSNVNASINFILYMLQGSRFRKEVKQLFCCCRSDRSVTVYAISTNG